MNKSTFHCLLLFVCATAVAVSSTAQESEQQRIERILKSLELSPISIPHVPADIKIDGKLDEAPWQQAAQVEVAWQHQPVGGVEARLRTTVFLMEDGEHLHVGFKAYDPEPQKIRAFLRDRDDFFRDDYVGFGLDTTGDGARSFEFFANPLGVQGDAIVDGQNGEDFSFDIIFETAGQIHADGYEVEFAIPISQIRFPQKTGKQEWKMFFTRNAPRERRYQNFNYPIDRSNSCFICQYQSTLGFENAKAGKRFQMVPSITANVAETTDPAVANSTERDNDTQLGIDDFRWGITPDISLNATVNPDFSQIEADAAQLSVNTNFALFYEERRPFFLEGRDLFNTSINIVNTRNIADPDYGVKVSGKSGANVYGLLSSKDSTTNILIPGSQNSYLRNLDQEYNANLLRYRHDFSDSSYLGLLVTDREGEDYSNQVMSLDGRYRINNKDTLSLQYVDTETENPDSLITDPNLNLQRDMSDAGYKFNYEHGEANWYWYVGKQVFGEDFRVDSGFLTQTDIDNTEGGISYHWRGPSGSFISQVNTGYDANYTKLDSTGNFLAKDQGAFLNGTFPGQTFVGFNRHYGEEVYNNVRFDTIKNELNIQTRPIPGLDYYGQFRYGDQIDFANTRLGKQLRIYQNIQYNLTRHLLVGIEYTHAKLKVDGDELFTANLLDLRLSYQFNLKSKLRLVLIDSDLKRDPALYINPVDRQTKSRDIQLLYSYKVNSQSVFFAGFSTSAFDDDSLSELSTTNKTAFIKWTYAWRL